MILNFILGTGLSFFSFGDINFEPDRHSVPGDTVYYIVFFDAMLKNNLSTQNFYQHGAFYDMTNEKKDIESQIEKIYSRYFTLVPVPESCVSKAKLDSISRREEDGIRKFYERCSLKGKLLIIDASWIVLDSKSVTRMMLSGGPDHSSFRSQMFGTWFIIRNSIYDETGRRRIYFETRGYAQVGATLPIKHHPRLGHTLAFTGHRRYFNRSLRRSREFLIGNKR